jgi:urea transport system permease protein
LIIPAAFPFSCSSIFKREAAILKRVLALLIMLAGTCVPGLCRAATTHVAASKPAVIATLRQAMAALGSDSDAQVSAVLDRIAASKNYHLIAALEGYQNGLLALINGKLVRYGSPIMDPSRGKLYPLLDAMTGKPVLAAGKPVLADSIPDNALMVPDSDSDQLQQTVNILSLYIPGKSARRQSIIALGNAGNMAYLAPLRRQLARRPSARLARLLRESIARILLRHGDTAQKIQAARILGQIHSTRGLELLRRTVRKMKNNPQSAVAMAAKASIAQIHGYTQLANLLFDSFAGLSLASIYVLIALGLAIIFGLMGVINMAQGEFMTIGAFTTFGVAAFFKSHFPAADYDWYFLCAIPIAFLVSALAGAVCEWAIIRRLYGRPLETLLATFGVSLILIQLIRVVFGNNNALIPPSWLSGGLWIMPGVIFPKNRLFIIVFCAGCIVAVYTLIRKTKLGLLLRATTQDREMAAALGVRTRLVDMLTFSLGTGLAGLAGCAVPLFSTLDPRMGQSYIVESFLVVVTGGVGNLAGVILAGTGLGFLEKFIEPWVHPVYGKVLVLIIVIAFLQWRPSGLFAAKGRSSDH